jgi:lipopolysaccharide export system protein LptC
MAQTRTLDRGVGGGSSGERVRLAAFARARSHSRRVRFLKLVLPTLAIIMAAAFLAYSWLITPASVSVDLAQSSFSGGKLVMAHPKLEGFTKDKLAYSVTAERAVQALKKTDVFRLEGIEAKLPISPGNWAMVKAPGGIYDRNKNTIDFTNTVTITTTDGMVARFRKAFFDIGNGTLDTTQPIEIKTDGLEIAADAMKVLENGKTLIFEKRVRMEIAPKRLQESRDTTGEANGG